jgi:hypothetical protein
MSDKLNEMLNYAIVLYQEALFLADSSKRDLGVVLPEIENYIIRCKNNLEDIQNMIRITNSDNPEEDIVICVKRN